MVAVTRDQVCAEAVGWLRGQQNDAIEFCALQGLALSWAEAKHHPIPLLYAWANLDQFEVTFFDFRPEDKAVRYALTRTGVFSTRYSGQELDEAVRTSSLNVLVGRYRSTQSETATNRKEGVAFAARLYQATYRYHVKLGSARNIGRVVGRARDDGVLDVDGGPDSETLYSALTIFLVSALEVGLHDAFFVHRHLWFRHLPENRQFPRALRKVAKRLTRSRRDRRALVRLMRQAKWAPGKCREVLAKHPDLQNLSFQDLDGKRGAKWAYRSFFGIALDECASVQDNEGWEIVRNVIDRRHLVIHSTTPPQPNRLTMNREIQMSKQYFGSVLREVTALDPLDRSTLL